MSRQESRKSPVGATVPDATTIFRFGEELANAQVIEMLFATFDYFLKEEGFRAQK
jgi:IS5 family transposase